MLYLFMTAKKRGKRKLNGAIVGQVINNVAKGKTTKQVLQVVPSISGRSVDKIRVNNRSLIEAKKEKYVKLIDKISGGDTKQAEVLSKILSAKTEIYNFKGDVVGVRPDHKIRLEAIKYIDKLKGREAPSVKLSQTNNYISKELDKYIS